MKIFISWSGPGSKSHTLAIAFHEWLPNVFQTIETFMSSDTLVAGERWQGGLSKTLEQSDFGIACLTPKSYHADWILFECGALAKKVDIARVVPVLCDVTGQMMSNHPLTMFNYVVLDEQGMKKLVESINANLPEHRLSKEKLEAAFKMWWPVFRDEHLKKVHTAKDEGTLRKAFDIEASMEEVLSILRSLARRPPYYSYDLGDLGNQAILNALLTVPTDTGSLIPSDDPEAAARVRLRFRNSLMHTYPFRPVASAGDGDAVPEKKGDAVEKKKKPPTSE